jgi:kynurenine formamidase
MSDTVSALLASLASGEVELVDLTQPLSETTPILILPPPFANTPGLTAHTISDYDEKGPAWSWRWLEIGEHVGTHFDAPIHWITGQGDKDIASIPVGDLVGPAVVFDRVAETEADPDYCLSVADVEEWVSEHGPLPEGGWLLLRTGWESRAHDSDLFLNASSGMPRTPGFDADCARYIAQETPIIGVGVETVGIDAGGAGGMEPPFPVHNFMLGAGKYGVTQLANLGKLPATGAMVVLAPLKLVRGTGSPIRALAFVPKA